MSSPETVLELIRKWAADHEIEMPSDINQTFDGSGFDSIHSVELAIFLEEKLGIPVDETVIWEKATFAALAQHLADRAGAPNPNDGKGPAGKDQLIGDAADW
ncbi:acyl carrier protein [Bradyrhizobium lablabi]|uniref:acyl carrier protein n=1 Tax=Bradyrhizobium lablabi TaxID=722472 RepID=UPI001BADF1B3|nr:acyl carrier protein [Bradyrhizobium lablabi]MBR0693226.1 acyl carrier protein [Bradyrhizobium lablabi]